MWAKCEESHLIFKNNKYPINHDVYGIYVKKAFTKATNRECNTFLRCVIQLRTGDGFFFGRMHTSIRINCQPTENMQIVVEMIGYFESSIVMHQMPFQQSAHNMPIAIVLFINTQGKKMCLTNHQRVFPHAHTKPTTTKTTTEKPNR